VWLVTGDTAATPAYDPQPTQLVTVAVRHGEAAPLALGRAVRLGGVDRAFAIAAGRPTVAPGTAIRAQTAIAEVVLLGRASAASDGAETVVWIANLEGELRELGRAFGVAAGIGVGHDGRQFAVIAGGVGAAGRGGGPGAVVGARDDSELVFVALDEPAPAALAPGRAAIALSP
jgi:hypothetical protein